MNALRQPTIAGTEAPLPQVPDVRQGTRLAGYEIEELIGRGGMGVVYRARHIHLGRTVALKLLGPEYAADPGFRERFVLEAQTAAELRHPSIVTVYDAGEADGLLYIAMELIGGTDLAEALKDGALAPARALDILGQIAGALDAAHAAGIVHRDVKPGNVLLDGEKAYLTDFGLTRRLGSVTRLTMAGAFVGTLEYVAPEQIEGAPGDRRADVYAFGAMLFHALTGSVPFDKPSQVSLMFAHMQESPPSAAELRPDLPAELDAVIAKAMAKRPEDRFESCAEVVAAARASLDGSAPPRPPTPLRPRRRALVAAPDSGYRAYARVSLAEHGFEVHEAESWEEAARIARVERPHLAVLDWSLPGRPAGEPLVGAERTLALVARAERIPDDELSAAGVEATLPKPFSGIQLLYRVRDLLGPEVLA